MNALLLRTGLQEAQVAELLQEVPTKWERLGDLALLPNQAFQSDAWRKFGGELWDTVAAALCVARLARQRPIANTGMQS